MFNRTGSGFFKKIADKGKSVLGPTFLIYSSVPVALFAINHIDEKEKKLAQEKNPGCTIERIPTGKSYTARAGMITHYKWGVKEDNEPKAPALK